MANKDRIKINFFVSYAHADVEYLSAFIDEFKEISVPSEKYEKGLWMQINGGR